mgnify:FL=1
MICANDLILCRDGAAIFLLKDQLKLQVLKGCQSECCLAVVCFKSVGGGQVPDFFIDGIRAIVEQFTRLQEIEGFVVGQNFGAFGSEVDMPRAKFIGMVKTCSSDDFRQCFHRIVVEIKRAFAFISDIQGTLTSGVLGRDTDGTFIGR